MAPEVHPEERDFYCPKNEWMKTEDTREDMIGVWSGDDIKDKKVAANQGETCGSLGLLPDTSPSSTKFRFGGSHSGLKLPQVPGNRKQPKSLLQTNNKK
mmetsp:Transcript_104679/g.180485  ORF Transcript_104679/g.180485 Transcript_104679/m.180485 type:complete len:99 (+) Transcript_104679:243-539(+)